jgi:serine phosphatase RsbU (regulator of sigma subunit)
LGRRVEEPDLLIDHGSVSKLHARITFETGQYFIEDLKSRNRTYVNGKEIKPGVRVRLRSDDRIDICDFRFLFIDETDDPVGISTIEATQGQVELSQYLAIAPSDRIQQLVGISQNLSTLLKLDELLVRLAEMLFEVFPQAERCFVLMLDSVGKPQPRVVKNRQSDGRDLRFSRTIVRNAVDSLQSFLSEDMPSDSGLETSDSLAELQIRSVMCVPLATAEARAWGAIQLDSQDKTKKFVAEDLNLLAIIANLASVAIEKTRLHEELLSLESVRSENRTARKVQLSLLPRRVPEVPGYEFFSHYSPAQTVGGDYYDFIALPGGRVAVVVGDVAGKGVPAALLVAKLSSEVRYCLVSEPDPARALALLNDQMLQGGLEELAGQFITLVVVILDPQTHEVTVVSAGHDSPKRYCWAEKTLANVLTADQSGYAIGWVPGDCCQYQAVQFLLEAGDTLVVYTDGVTDARNLKNERFGENRIWRSLKPESNIPESARPAVMGSRLLTAVEQHLNGRPQLDDIAIVCFGRLTPDQDPLR